MWLTLSNIAAICAMLWVLTAAQDPNAGSPDPFRPGKKYWIDKESCGTRPEFKVWFDNAVTEARYLAGYVAQRTRPGSLDTDFLAVVQQIMGTTVRYVTEDGETKSRRDPPSAKQLETVRRIMIDITLYWEETKNREEADTRWYCDNDDRWKRVYENDVQPRLVAIGKEPSSKLLQEWHDETNGMYEVRDLPRCHEVQQGADGKGTVPLNDAVHYRGRFMQSGQNPGRTTNTLCDSPRFAILKARRLPSLLTLLPDYDFNKIWTPKDKPILKVDVFTLWPSVVLLHEWSHFYMTKDHAYGWQALRALDGPKAIENADSYAYLGIYGWLAERNWGMPRSGDSHPDPDGMNKLIAEEGGIRWYKDLTSVDKGLPKPVAESG